MPRRLKNWENERTAESSPDEVTEEQKNKTYVERTRGPKDYG